MLYGIIFSVYLTQHGTLMLRLFKRLSIVQTTIISVSFLTVFALTLSAFSLTATWQKLQQDSQDKNTLQLMDVLEKVAHHHAVERGLTAGYLGAPDPDKKQALQTQRDKADSAVATLRELAQQTWPQEFELDKQLSLLEEILSQKSTSRQAVDNLAAPNAFSYYSKVNKVALDTLQTLRMNIIDWRVQKKLSGIINLAWFKERAGQLRGKINGVLAKGNMPALAKAEVSQYINDLQLLEQYLKRILEAQQLEQFQQILNDENSRAITQVHQQIIATDPGSLEQSDFPSSERWFPMATKQIGEVKGLLDLQWQQLHAQINQSKTTAATLLITEGVVLSLIVLFIGVLNINLVNSLRRKLKQLTQSLKKVADEGDLTENIQLNCSDELGHISNAIQNTIYSFKVLIIGLAKSISTSSRLSNHINDVSNQVLIDAKSTQQLATSIATAVEQMAATSDEIARSAASTLEASDALNKNAERTSAVNQGSRAAMFQLNQYMQEVETKAGSMEEQVGTISGILDTINNLSEQTNLLALNAAIEAARAGESGRGFAVVADEVRNLAKSSKQSSDRIAELLKGLQVASNDVASAVKNNVNSTQQTLKRVEEAQQISEELKIQANKVESLSHQVATAAEQQSAVAKEIAHDANKVLTAANNELHSAEEMLTIFEELKINNGVLSSTMKNFKIE